MGMPDLEGKVVIVTGTFEFKAFQVYFQGREPNPPWTVLSTIMILRVFSTHLQLTASLCIISGGNTGIGKETIRALLTHNAKVYMASRNEEKAQAAIEQLKTDTGHEAIFLQLDLASLASVRKAAEEFLRCCQCLLFYSC
jgi:predicted ATPase